jgi:hypothetical protein
VPFAWEAHLSSALHFRNDPGVLGTNLNHALSKDDDANRRLTRFEEKLTSARRPADTLEKGVEG